MTDVPEALKKRRDELANIIYDSVLAGRVQMSLNEQSRHKAGFNACWEEVAPLIEALEFYARDKNWRFTNHDQVGSFSTIESDDGRVAREALKKVRGDASL